MAARSTMANLITKVRSMIYDPAGGSQIFSDQDIQDQLDASRINVRYEQLTPGPAILNAASTNNVASFIWADFFSRFQWWEDDVVLQGNNVTTHASWVVLTPASSENFYGHWAFETSIFTTGTTPGQYPPVFATGKSFDVYAAAASLLDLWSAQYAAAYDVTVDQQQFRRSQIFEGKQKLAEIYRKRARVVSVTPLRTDLQPAQGAHTERVDLWGSNDRLGRDA